MGTSRIKSVAVRLFALVLAVICPPSKGAIIVDLSNVVGPKVEYWGWDLKGKPDLFDNPRQVEKHYSNGANLLRIPIYANADSSDGVTNQQVYAAVIAGVKNVMAAHPEIKIFASLKLEGAHTFPAWMNSTEKGKIFDKTVSDPDPGKYAQMLTDYVVYMQQNGIKLDYLGINNEVENALTPQRYVSTVNALREQLQHRNVSAEYAKFKLVGPETFSVRAGLNYLAELAGDREGIWFDMDKAVRRG